VIREDEEPLPSTPLLFKKSEKKEFEQKQTKETKDAPAHLFNSSAIDPKGKSNNLARSSFVSFVTFCSKI
jgi:hypothetical protein